MRKKNELNRNRKIEKLMLASFHKIPSDYAAREKFIDKIARFESILAALDMATESILGVWVSEQNTNISTDLAGISQIFIQKYSFWI